MRGTHYGADYRWFTRFIGDEVDIPQVVADREKVDHLLADRGVRSMVPPAPDPADLKAVDYRQVTGGNTGMSADAIAARLPARGDSRYPPGSLKAAIERSKARGAFEQAALSLDHTPPLTPEVKALAERIHDSINPNELAEFSFDQLLAAFRSAHMSPGLGAKLVNVWAQSRKFSPEQVVAAIKRAKDDWVARANHGPPTPPQLQTAARSWDFDRAVADMLGQRNNVGRGPKDIDRERLILLQRLMASFSGQANYGFDGAEAAASAVGAVGVLS